MSSNSYPAVRLFTRLVDRGLRLSVDGDQLRVTPPGRLSLEEQAQIRAEKANLIAVVLHPPLAGERPSVYACPVMGCGTLIPWGERRSCPLCVQHRRPGQARTEA